MVVRRSQRRTAGPGVGVDMRQHQRATDTFNHTLYTVVGGRQTVDCLQYLIRLSRGFFCDRVA